MTGAAARRRRQGRGGGQPADGAGNTPRPEQGGRGITPFDGPASRGTGSATGSQGRPASNAPSSVTGPPQGGSAIQGEGPGSRRSSVSQPQSQVGQLQTDPARENQKKPSKFDDMRNFDLPAGFHNLDYQLDTEFTKRPAFNSTGKVIGLPVNSYNVTQFPDKTIYQYDVQIGNGAEKRMVVKKVWDSKLRGDVTGPGCIFDGNKLAWSMNDLGTEIRRIVDLDVEEGRPSRDGKNSFRLGIRRSRKLDLSIIHAYLAGKIQHSIQVAEAISFMDHLLREGPSNNKSLVAVKRSFFVRGAQKADLGGSVEVFRGVYQSVRLAEGQKLVVNLDVSNTCFWKPGMLLNVIIGKNKYRDVNHLQQSLSNPANARATLRYLNRLTVKATYQGNKYPNKEWKIKTLSSSTANTHQIEWKDPQTGKPDGKKINLTAYFKRRYNLQLQYPNLWLVEMTKKDVVFPLELLEVLENQRYASKLDEIQTANMIKFAVAPPNIRLKGIEEGKAALNWQTDMHLSKYGMKINPQQIITQARILPAPGIKFGRGKTEQPGTKGRWDMRGKAFLSTNPQELVSWGVGYFENGRTRLEPAGLEKFAMDFQKAYRGHGGTVANGLPHIMKLPNDAGQAVNDLYQATGNKFKRVPQLLIFLVQDRNSMHYLRIKKSCDCRFGISSQVMQAAQVQKGSPQYYSNVLLKVNAKLGGCTSQVAPAASSGFKAFTVPTMFIGADVSHASPGSEQPSMAALTVSFDTHAGRYVAACQTNGFRKEMITNRNFFNMLGPLTTQWSSTVGRGGLPQQIYYMRDGVSESQFAQVINEEVPMIKAVMVKIANGQGWKGKVTVVIASKRHHIRAFPKQGDGDQKGNPLPGTLIEKDITMPNEWDFYLYSHIALQGTSRPVHYTVIMDEAKHPANYLQNMIYEHCYQYMRSTTSVSLHPAVYYAHLASNRAKAHEDVAASAGPQGGPGQKINEPKGEEPRMSEAAPLMPIFKNHGLPFSMWYI